MRPLTDAERDIVSANSSLVSYAMVKTARAQVAALCRLGWEWQDVQQELYAVLIRAVLTHDPAKSSLANYFLQLRVRDRLSHLLRLAVVRCHERLRRPIPVDGGFSAVDGADCAAAVRAAVDRADLTPEERHVTDLRFRDGMTLPQIADHTGYRFGTVRGAVRRANAKIRRELAGCEL